MVITQHEGGAHPPLEGEGRLTESEAKREAGWGDLSSGAGVRGEIAPPRSPASRAIDPPPPGEGGGSQPAAAATSRALKGGLSAGSGTSVSLMSRRHQLNRCHPIRSRGASAPSSVTEFCAGEVTTKNGAQERTRTFTAVKPLAPEASASTNSATWAWGRCVRIERALVKPLNAQDDNFSHPMRKNTAPFSAVRAMGYTAAQDGGPRGANRR